MRFPKCDFLVQEKSARENEGVDIWKCSKYNITWLGYIESSQTAIDEVSGINKDKFKECKLCEYNQNR